MLAKPTRTHTEWPRARALHCLEAPHPRCFVLRHLSLPLPNPPPTPTLSRRPHRPLPSPRSQPRHPQPALPVAASRPGIRAVAPRWAAAEPDRWRDSQGRSGRPRAERVLARVDAGDGRLRLCTVRKPRRRVGAWVVSQDCAALVSREIEPCTARRLFTSPRALYAGVRAAGV